MRSLLGTSKIYTALFLLIFLSLVLLALFVSSSVLLAEIETSWVLGTKEHGFETSKNSLALDKTKIELAQDRTQDIVLKRKNHKNHHKNIVYLDFESEQASLLRDKSGHAQIKMASYYVSKKAQNGNYSALFNAPKHKTVFNLEKRFWKKGNHDFKIEMWFQPIFLSDKNILLQKKISKKGSFGGLEISIENLRLIIALNNIFKDYKNELQSLHLSSVEKIQLGKWHHLSFIYKASTASLIFYLNGREQEILSASDKKQFWKIRNAFFDSSPFIIASKYIGRLDEFRITKQAIDSTNGPPDISPYGSLKINFETQRAEQTRGKVYSKLLHFPKKNMVNFAKISYKSIEPKDSSLYLYLRYSNTPFNTNEQGPSWHRIPKSGKLFSNFRYFQWKARLASDPLGQYSPRLKEIKINYSIGSPPTAPQDLHLMNKLSQDLRPCLEWKQSTTQNKELGHYVYYGLRPNKYLGRLEYYQDKLSIKKIIELFSNPNKEELQASPLKLKKLFQNRRRLIISNDSIIKDMSMDRKKNLPLLRYDRNYYFAVSSYNSFGESALSNEVMVVFPPR